MVGKSYFRQGACLNMPSMCRVHPRQVLKRTNVNFCVSVWSAVRSSAVACSVGFLGLLSVGCSSDIIPPDSQLSLTPETHSTRIVERQNEDGHCLYNVDNHVDIPLLMQLSNASGSPIGDTIINVYADFAANTYTGLPVLSLYDDINNNGVVDADTELVSGVENDIARVSTGKWTGTRALLLRVNLSCAFKGAIFAYAGSASASANIEVVADSIEDITTVTEENF